jgi:23S rRNA (uracil1939-C5)-methyltransferase
MPLEEADQRRWKRTLVADALRRIGRSEVPVEEILASPRALGYRNKVEFTLGRDVAGRPAVGLHSAEPEGRWLVDVDRCPVQTDVANDVLATARAFLLPRAAEWLDTSKASEPFRLIIRASGHDGRVLVVLRETTEPFPGADALARRLKEGHAAVAGVVRLRARPGQRGGARIIPVLGRNWIEGRVGEIPFRLPAGSFLQVNPEAASLLLELVREAAGEVEGRTVVDLYAGVGAFGIDLARRGAAVTACDADIEAVRCGRSMARRVAAGRITFRHADASTFLRRHVNEAHRAEIVVANPPRAGLGPRVAEQIANLEARRVIVVSCDPATLARDTRRLTKAGFLAEKATPVDVFPQTAHVETVLVLSRT